jgi:uncharacterized protein
MIKRLLYNDILYALANSPAVVILGPRQVGKSTIASMVADQYPNSQKIDLEIPSDREKLSDAQSFFENNFDKLIVIDEIQRLPQLFEILRPMIDMHRVSGRFLVTGSASPHLVKGVSESLAGRSKYIYLNPINLAEALQSDIPWKTHWFRGGFPLSIIASTDQLAQDWLDDFITSYIERDLAGILGHGFLQGTMRNLWSMVAHSNGNVWNASVYSRSLGVTMPTIKNYIELLEAAFIIRQLPAWFVNTKKRLIKSPKIYFRDSGILHRLCRIHQYRDLFGHPVAGSSWEGYVIEQIAQLKPRELDVYYYRTQNGAECDLLLVNGIMPIACIEIKISSTPKVTKGFYECISDLGTKKNYVVTPASDTYENFGITICSLQNFVSQILPKLNFS